MKNINILNFLKVDESFINYILKDGVFYHTLTNEMINSFFLERLIEIGTSDIILQYDKSTDSISYRNLHNSDYDIYFSQYSFIGDDLQLFYNNMKSYCIPLGKKMLFDDPNHTQSSLAEGDCENHFTRYRTYKKEIDKTISIIYRLQYIGYPKIADNDSDSFFDAVHSLDFVDIQKCSLSAMSYVNNEYLIVPKYSSFLLLNSQLKNKFAIYKKALALLPKPIKGVYRFEQGPINVFVNDKKKLDFTVNMKVTHKLSGEDAFKHVDAIIKHKEKFNLPSFGYFLNSFERPFNEHFKQNDFVIDVKINSVDDLIMYRNLVNMSQI